MEQFNLFNWSNLTHLIIFMDLFMDQKSWWKPVIFMLSSLLVKQHNAGLYSKVPKQRNSATMWCPPPSAILEGQYQKIPYLERQCLVTPDMEQQQSTCFSKACTTKKVVLPPSHHYYINGQGMQDNFRLPCCQISTLLTLLSSSSAMLKIHWLIKLTL